jgi:two-component system OmpR family response regulator
LTRPSILIVEDNAPIRQMLALALHEFDLTIHLASNGQEAVEIYQKERIDLVLMDVRMPRLDGPDTFAVLKHINPNVICCFLSGNTGPYTREDLYRMGAIEVIDKPFRLEELNRVLFRLLPQCAPKAAAAESELGVKNRRTCPRRTAKAEVDVTCTTSPPAHERNLAWTILDISESGLGLLMKTPLNIGAEVSVRLRTPSSSRAVVRAGRVVWSAPATAQSYGVGVRLEERMADPEIHQLTY